MELSNQEYQELTGGGPTELHHHPKNVSHRDLELLQEAHKIRSVFGTYTATLADDILVANTTSGNFTITLPPARGQKEYIITKAVAANTLTIAFSNSETCYGQATLSIMALGGVLRLKSFNDGWITI